MNKSMYQLVPLSKEQLLTLSNTDLCERMDNVLYNILCESYTDARAIDHFPRQSIKEFFNTTTIQSLSQKHQRDAIRKCFEYLVQHEYLSRISGWLNQAVYGADYDESHSWLSTRKQNINCAVNQIKIVGSGIACDRMMDLLYIIESGKTLSGKSKFKPFRKWLLNVENRFVFFAPNLLHIYKFRSKLRTAEVHEWSSQPDKLLQLMQPTFEENNESLDLINILLPMWLPLLDLLNGKIPPNTSGSGAGIEWLNAIIGHDVFTIQQELDRLNAQLIS